MGEQTSKKQKTGVKSRSQSASKTVRRTSSRREKTSKSQKNTIFAEGLSFRKLFFIFLICSVFGTIYEDLLIYFTEGQWMLHRGVIYGPFNVIYGFGGALMCWILLRKPYKNWQIFGLAALVGGLVEYMLSLLQEIFTGTTSWDYSALPLNIAGRTTIPIMLFWGVLGLILVKMVYPFLSNLIEKIPPKAGEIAFRILLVLMVVDMLVSWTAILRQNLRHQGTPPFTPVGEFYDQVYTDEYLHKYFPNMVRSSGND